MGIPILIIGKSGSGKSTSLRNFKEDIGIINVLGKPLPFKNSLPTIKTDDYAKIRNALSASKTSSMVIDDSGYLMTNGFMRGHAKNSSYAFFNTIADEFWGLINFVTDALPENKLVYFLMHEDKNEAGDIKPKSIGRLLDEKVCIEGMFTIVLRAYKENGKHYFSTQSNGFDVAKTPLEMFEEGKIDNDLLLVDNKIREYYNIKK